MQLTKVVEELKNNCEFIVRLMQEFKEKNLTVRGIGFAVLPIPYNNEFIDRLHPLFNNYGNIKLRYSEIQRMDKQFCEIPLEFSCNGENSPILGDLTRWDKIIENKDIYVPVVRFYDNEGQHCGAITIDGYWLGGVFDRKELKQKINYIKSRRINVK